MSSVFIHTGQCGNQIGREYWRLVEGEHRNDLTHLLSISNTANRHRTANCVMVDSEPKVVMETMLNLKRIFDVNSSACIDSSGRANNWAMGYYR